MNALKKLLNKKGTTNSSANVDEVSNSSESPSFSIITKSKVEPAYFERSLKGDYGGNDMEESKAALSTLVSTNKSANTDSVIESQLSSSYHDLQLFNVKFWRSINIVEIPESDVLNKCFEYFMIFKNVDDDKKDLMRSIPNHSKWEMIKQSKQEIIHHIQEGKHTDSIEITMVIRGLEGVIQKSFQKLDRGDFKKLKIMLKNKPISWLKDFTKMGGVEKMMTIISFLQKKKNISPMEMEIEHELILGVRAYMNNGFGFSQVLESDSILNVYASSISSVNFDTSTTVIEALAAFCHYGTCGHKKVIHAFDHYNGIYGVHLRFEILTKVAKTALNYLEKNIIYKSALHLLVSCFMLVNAVCRTPSELFYRIQLRNELYSAGWQDVLNFVNSPNFLNPDIDCLYKSFCEAVEADTGLYLDTFQLFKIDWQDPIYLTRELFNSFQNENKADSTTKTNPAYQYLLNTIQLLHFIKNDPNKMLGYYKLINGCVQYIVLDSKGIDPDFTKAYELNLSQVILSLISSTENFALHDKKISISENAVGESSTLAKSLDKALESPSFSIGIEKPSSLLLSNEHQASEASQIHTGINVNDSKNTLLLPPLNLNVTISFIPPPPPHIPLETGSSMESFAGASVQIPPPLPPPPPFPNAQAGLKPGSIFMKFKTLPWEKLNETNDTIWEAMEKENIQFPTNYTDKIEAEFTIDPLKKILNNNALFNNTFSELTYLDSNKARNLNIILGRLRVTLNELIQAILVFDEKILDESLITQFLHLIPTPTQDNLLITKYKTASERDISRFGKADQFLFQIFKVDFLTERLESLKFKLGFKEKATSLNNNIQIIIHACCQLQDSNLLKQILSVILTWGNRLNEGTIRGCAKGITLSSLEKIIEIKSTKKNVTLLRFLIEALGDFHKGIERVDLEKELSLISEASKRIDKFWSKLNECIVNLVQLEEDLKHLNNSSTNFNDLIKKLQDSNDTQSFILESFFETASSEMNSLTEYMSTMKETFSKTAAFFGEKAETWSYEEFFGMFASLITTFQKTYKLIILEKEERIQKEKRLNLKQSKLNSKTLPTETVPGAKIDIDENERGTLDNLLSSLKLPLKYKLQSNTEDNMSTRTSTHISCSIALINDETITATKMLQELK